MPMTDADAQAAKTFCLFCRHFWFAATGKRKFLPNCSQWNATGIEAEYD
jgi:hypothetical protein